MKSVEKIEIVFENCDCLTFKIRDFYDFVIENVRPRVNRVGSNCIAKSNIADIYFHIFKGADKSYNEFGQEDWERSKFERIKNGCDITSVVLTYGDGTSEEFYPVWIDKDPNGCTNSCMEARITERGDLKVVITANRENSRLYERYLEDNEDDLDFCEDFFSDEEEEETEEVEKKDPDQAYQENKEILESSIIPLTETERETKAVKDFMAKHYKSCNNPDKYIYEVTGTGLGACTTIKCPVCGKSKDITDEDKF